MKKVLCGILVVLLVTVLAGCGGGGGGSSPVGKAMTNDETNAKYDTASEGMDALDMGTAYIVDPLDSMTELTDSFKAFNASTFNWPGLGSGFKAFDVGVTLIWTSTGSGGWYTTTETDDYGIIYTYWIRYLEASNTIELKGSFSETAESDSETITFNLLSKLTQGSDSKWNGSMNVTMTTTSMGTMKMDYTFANVDGTAYGSGTYKMWVAITGGPMPMSRIQFADYTVSYDSTNEPPIKLTGWYGIGDHKFIFPEDYWVPIPII